jgi:uroporphyrin-III C-methyltransferase
VSDEVLALAPAACLKIQTGKRAGRASMKQETINRLMLRLARRGLTVVRLKGGDPSIFGRVGEEIQFLRGHGIAVEVVPGVTAACAAAAQFQFPLTNRKTARRVVFTTARVEDGALIGDWRVAADPEATAAIYMGGSQLGAIAQHLISAGRSPTTPIAVIESAGGPGATLVGSTLSACGRLNHAWAGGPILFIVGDVVAGAQQAVGQNSLWGGSDVLRA